MRPGQRHLYRVSSTLPRTGSPLRPAICLTCTISSDMTNDDESGHRTSSSNWQNGLTNRNEWHEIPTDNINSKEHRQAKDISKKDKLKKRNALSECQHYFSYLVLSCFKSLKFIIVFSHEERINYVIKILLKLS